MQNYYSRGFKFGVSPIFLPRHRVVNQTSYIALNMDHQQSLLLQCRIVFNYKIYSHSGPLQHVLELQHVGMLC